MPKITLDMSTFKALASDTRLDILRALDGKNMRLNDICRITNLNKATLHEHLTKLNEAGLVRKNEREGHKWVYYRLTWKGEGLLHPENNRIVVLFTITFIILFIGIVNLVNFVKGYVVAKAVNFVGSNSTAIYAAEGTGDYLTHSVEFSRSVVATVPLNNQTTSKLSQSLIDTLNLKGIVGNSIQLRNLEWKNLGTDSSVYNGVVKDGLLGAGKENIVGVQNSMIAIIHDPALQYIAIACITIFAIILSIGIWRLWKNKIPKL